VAELAGVKSAPFACSLPATFVFGFRCQGTGHRTPIICLTANAGETQARACLDAGGDMHVPKPYRAQALLDAVGRALSYDLGD